VNDAFKIATLFGIPIRVHWTFLILLFFFMMAAEFWLVAILFGCVLLHELGHSLAARSFGIRVIDITFWPLGGMARMSEIPEEPRTEGLIALAGPAVNFALAALATLAILSAQVFLGSVPGHEVLGLFLFINLLLGGFNLLPAFPMDGGRLLRAWLARKRDWVSATETAVRVGRAVAGGMLIFTLVMAMSNVQTFCVLPLIAIFVWFAGGRELMAVRMRHGLSPFGSVQFGGPFTGEFRGARSAEASWQDAPREEEGGQDTGEDAGGARRPDSWGGEPRRGGFDAETIRKLEAFRGRLRKPPQDD
jgi:Zn-dependent protease